MLSGQAIVTRGTVVAIMMVNDATDLTVQLKQEAQRLGFCLVGVTHAVSPDRLREFHEWLARGFAGEMSYLERRRHAYQHPQSILDGCKSLVMLGTPYLFDEHQRNGQNPNRTSSNASAKSVAKVARYAQSAVDYHKTIRLRLKELKGWLIANIPNAAVRGIVDTAPLHEREFAQKAGLGWIGKNTLLLNKNWGSYFFLAALLTNVELVADQPHHSEHCGTCSACLEACPTEAFVAPYQMDATRCLSYVTIESRSIPQTKIAEKMSDWIFGCDICQEVCPWNRRSQTTSDSAWQPQQCNSRIDPLEILQMDEASFAVRFKQTPLWRPGYLGLLRNAILVAGTQRLMAAKERLTELSHHASPVIRAATAWALGQLDLD